MKGNDARKAYARPQRRTVGTEKCGKACGSLTVVQAATEEPRIGEQDAAADQKRIATKHENAIPSPLSYCVVRERRNENDTDVKENQKRSI